MLAANMEFAAMLTEKYVLIAPFTYQLRFKLDVEFSALVYNFNFRFSNWQ